jgi:hypothetical protein
VQLLATLRVTSLEVEDVGDILNTIRSQGTTDYHYRGGTGLSRTLVVDIKPEMAAALQSYGRDMGVHGL